MTGARVLVVNADDFGRSPGINRGIEIARARGIVTSASLMVRWPSAADAAVIARRDPGIAVGLHVDLAEWVFDDEWQPVYEVVATDDRAAVEREIEHQLEMFVGLVGRPPTHLDSHQHVHREEPVRSVLAEVGAGLGVPVRQVTAGITYCGAFYGQDGRGHPVPEAITVDALVSLLRALPAGVTELGCHPGEAESLDNGYADERAAELEVLCDPRILQAIADAGIELVSFADLVGAGYADPGGCR